jgi:hypothetical protein
MGGCEDIEHVTTAGYEWTDALRLLGRSSRAVLLLFCLGCSSSSKPLPSLPNPFGQSAKDEVLHKQVQADSFPTAKQAGL